MTKSQLIKEFDKIEKTLNQQIAILENLQINAPLQNRIRNNLVHQIEILQDKIYQIKPIKLKRRNLTYQILKKKYDKPKYKTYKEKLAILQEQAKPICPLCVENASCAKLCYRLKRLIQKIEDDLIFQKTIAIYHSEKVWSLNKLFK